jgi:predicted dehydrogenase
MRVAFIDAGKVSNFHQEAISRMTGLELVGVYDAAAEVSARQAMHWGVRTYENFERLLGDERVEGVYVLTPPATHADLALRSLEAEKHVPIEKPVSPSQEDLARVAQAARATDKGSDAGAQLHLHA